MDLSGQSHRVVAGCAIAIAHAGIVYGLMTLSPRSARADLYRPITVHFLEQPGKPPAEWRPPEVVAAPLTVQTDQPPLAAIDLPAPPSDRAITAPQQRISVAVAREDASIPKLVSAVEYLREPAPRYPTQSRRLREQGVVVLRVVIDERGHACDIAIESSSGYARLDRAAREAVASAAFRPYVEDGAPRRAQVLIPIEFFLNRTAA